MSPKFCVCLRACPLLHASLPFPLLRLLDLFGGPVPARTVFMREAIRSPRYGIEFGSGLLILLISLAFSIISPLIPLFGFAFFAGMWLFWRYASTCTGCCVLTR